jgi:hypothetical protein
LLRRGCDRFAADTDDDDVAGHDHKRARRGRILTGAGFGIDAVSGGRVGEQDDGGGGEAAGSDQGY